MTEPDRCPKCGNPLSPGAAPGEYCPRCLLALGLEAETDPSTTPPEPAKGSELVEGAGGTESTEINAVESTQPGRIGPYRLTRKLGEGGMGEVYEAEQQEPVRRKVALKLIKWGMDTRRVVARFEAERQALAMMDHPNIARVFDAGATEQGRPYFAMELVKGVPITDYCDRHRLSTRQRLELFQLVCQGVQHAHQKGIIHRDIKPSNVMLTIQDDKPVPKIIDFGVAKATEQRLTEKTVFTELGQLVGTPEYMSPEQAEMTGLDIDTRTDVYSLGVLLYELLSGALPFEPRVLRKAGYDEIRRRIREDEPAKPSTRISSLGEEATTAANNRSTAPGALVRRLRGDLDWISMRALEKDRTRRYGSPADLAADLERHLQSEPVLAGPPSAAYKMKKFVRRHRFGVAAASVVLVALLLGAVGTTVGMVRAVAAEKQAREEARRAEASNLFALGREIIEDNPSGALAYAMASLEAADNPSVRQFATEVLWRGPTALVTKNLGEYALFLNYSPDGRRLAAGGWQGLHKVWTPGGSLATFAEGQPFGHEKDELVHVDFSSDGRFHVSSGEKGIRIWSVPDAKAVRFLEIQPWWHGVRGRRLLTFTPLADGRSLSVQWWPLGEGAPDEVGHWKPPMALADEIAILRVDVDPEGEWLAYATGSELFVLPLDHIDTARPVRVGRGLNEISRVSFHPDGQRIATLERIDDEDGVIRLWSRSSDSGEPLRSFEAPVPKFRDPPAALGKKIRFDPDGRWMVALGKGSTTFLWDLAAPPGAEPLVLPKSIVNGPVNSTGFHPDGTWLAVANTTVSIWPLKRTYPHVIGPATHYPVIDRQGDWVVAGSWDGKLRLWPLRDGIEPRTLLDTDGVGIHGLALSPDGTRIAAGLWDGRVLVVPVSGGEPVELTGFSSGLFAVAFDPEGRRVAAAGQKLADDSIIRVWDLDSGEVQLLEPLDRRGIMSLDFTPDGRLVAGTVGGLLLWDLEAGTNEILLPVPADGHLSPDGRYFLAACALEGEDITSPTWTATVYDLEERRSWRLETHGERLLDVAWHPNSEYVVTGSTDGSIRVGPMTGEEPHLLLGQTGWIKVAVHPDGGSIVAAGDESLRVWPWPEGQPLHTLPYDEFLTRLGSLTNLRVARDDTTITGYRLDVGAFPGWKNTPTW